MLTENYASILGSTIQKICETQADAIKQAADMVRRTIAGDGLIYVFGCGHSHMMSEEIFYRAGGLACVCPVFYEPLMLHESASYSSQLEKQSGIASKVLEPYSFSSRDLFFCISTSGVNAVPVETAQAVKEMGVPVIAITSSSYLSQTPKNPLHKHLCQCCSLWLDNFAPHGDACLHIQGVSVPMTPVSSVTSAFLLNSVLAEGTKLAAEQGISVPVYLSGNIPGGTEFNAKLISKYKNRIVHL